MAGGENAKGGWCWMDGNKEGRSVHAILNETMRPRKRKERDRQRWGERGREILP